MAGRGSKPGERRGGRRKGIPNKATERVVAEQAEAGRAGLTPLEHMLGVMRTPMPTQLQDESPEAFMSRCKWHIARQDSMAVAAANFVHARLSSVETKQDPLQFAKEQAAKLDAMDTTEIARRLVFFLAEQQRKRQKEKSNAQGNQGRQGRREVEEGIRH